MNRDYIMLGDGGHASVCRDVAKRAGFVEAGYVLGRESNQSESDSDSCFLGTDEWLLQKTGEKPFLINGIGGEPHSKVRSHVFDRYSSLDFKFLTIIHPSAQIAENVILGEGVQIMAGVVIQPNCSIKSNSIINTRASLDHDCAIQEDVHIAPGAVLCGNVVVGKGAFVGAMSCIIPGINIGLSATIGAGTTVLADVGKGLTFFGK
jgi:sugar O-acyltransferase (sialic acid O-acetyltransferase NeuD family)